MDNGNIYFKIELIEDGLIYVERTGDQAENHLAPSFKRLGKIAKQLRQQRKPVLILNYTVSANVSPRVLDLLLGFDFDKLAVYGTSRRVNDKRDLMVRANGMEQKILSFLTKEEAIAWLRSS